LAVELDLTSLNNAINRLREGLARHRQEPNDEQLRDGLIQRFEFTYEQTHRFLRRYMRLTAGSPDDVDAMTFQDLIRTAKQLGLLRGDWPAWHRYRDLRARSSNTCDAETATEVVTGLPEFLAEADFLKTELRRRLA
jgi:nucleotidyltransferase substrate binding protein (TIGR01987 family)